MIAPDNPNSRDPAHDERWSVNLEDVDREIARLAGVCQIQILQPGVIDRVLRNDSSVCGTTSAIAFRKLHYLLLLHQAIRGKAAESFGEAQTAAIEDYVIGRLRKLFPRLEGPWPPASQ
jgi:hypothetical protein